MLLSAAAMFLIVFGIQEGERYDWGTISGPITVWGLIVAGIVVLGSFLLWQRFNAREPLLPLRLFRDRNFSLANLGITTMGFVVTGVAFPMMLFAQVARGLTPTRAALLLIPMAVISAGLAPVVGKVINRRNPRCILVAGFTLEALALLVYSLLMHPGHSILWLLIPSAIMGLANAGIWGPLSVTATRNLGPADVGAGSGVYNTTRQVGSVLGTGGQDMSEAAFGAGRIPAFLEAGFSTAMSQSLLVPAAVALLGGTVRLGRPYFGRRSYACW